jgi:signal transduction histidine kinase
VLHLDSLGNLWIGTWSSGLNLWDPATRAFVRYQHDPDDPYSLSDDRIRAISRDSHGLLWVGTSGGGLNAWDSTTERFTHYTHDAGDPTSLSNDVVFSVCEDLESTLWIGTAGGGLNRFDRDTQSFARYTEKDGLPNDVVYGVLADRSGRLWLSTNNGLSRFDPRSERFRNYDVTDGLQHNEFNAGAYHQSASGEMFFGGIGGFNAFYPESVRDNPHIPPIVITGFSKLNQRVQGDLPPDERISLSHQDSFISFDFAALDYAAPQKNQYAYMLEGQDPGWVYAGARRHVDYTNLRGGDYVFRVKGSNNDGVWNERGTAVYLAVTPPVWQTWWFRGVMVLLLAGTAMGAYRLRVRSLRIRGRELARQVEERSRELASMVETERHRVEQFRVIGEVGQRITALLSVDELLEQIAFLVKDAFDYSMVGIGLIEGNDLVFRTGSAAFTDGSQLREPLRIRVGEEGISGWVAYTGEPFLVPDVRQEPRYYAVPQARETRSELAVPLKLKGRIIGVLDVESDRVDAFSDSDMRMLQSLASQAAIAIENARLYERAQELAAVEERQRLARDLHDAVSQTLFSASLISEVLPRLWDLDQAEGRRRLEELRELTRGALAEMRTLLMELRPTALADAKLGDSLGQLSEAARGRARIPVTFDMEGPCSMPPGVKVSLYRIAQEALNNVVKHAEASRAWISLHCTSAADSEHGDERSESQRVELQISDDGRGFDPANAPPDRLGLAIMSERAEDAGIALTIESDVGRGTRVVAIWEGVAGNLR